MPIKPSRLDCSDIVAPKSRDLLTGISKQSAWQNIQLKHGLREEEDFLLVTPQIFEFATKKYGLEETPSSDTESLRQTEKLWWSCTQQNSIYWWYRTLFSSSLALNKCLFLGMLLFRTLRRKCSACLTTLCIKMETRVVSYRKYDSGNQLVTTLRRFSSSTKSTRTIRKSSLTGSFWKTLLLMIWQSQTMTFLLLNCKKMENGYLKLKSKLLTNQHKKHLNNRLILAIDSKTCRLLILGNVLILNQEKVQSDFLTWATRVL